MKRFYTIFVCLLAMMLGGCVISPRRTVGGGTGSGGSGGGGTGATGGQLYVTTPNSILRFSNAETVNGNTAPDATITSSAFSILQRLIVDPTNDRLYVVSQGSKSILIFDNASTLTGNVTPTRAIVGGNTGLNTPLDLALDTNNDLLYVADGSTLLLFTSASTVNGNVAPANGGVAFGNTIGGLFLDVTNNLLYESDPAGATINQLSNPNIQTGFAQVTAQIAGPDTKLSQPRGLTLDRSNRLFVSNSATPVSITSYQNASTANGDTIPVGTVSGSATLLQSPQQMLVNNNITNDELYVADPGAGSVLIYTNVVTTQGDLAPARTISGSSTGLAVNGIRGLALDTTR